MSPTGSASSPGAGLAPAPRAASRFSRFTRATRWARRAAFLVHRWLGIALALLMALWTLSGFVMMYVSYPATTAAERAAGLDPLDLAACCAKIAAPEGPIDNASVEMLLGRPVIVTGYSGNVDFTDADTACVVNYRLVDVQPGEYPHGAGQRWAEPDLEQAAAFMRRVFEERQWAAALAERGRARVEAQHGLSAAGAHARARLQELGFA